MSGPARTLCLISKIPLLILIIIVNIIQQESSAYQSLEELSNTRVALIFDSGSNDHSHALLQTAFMALVDTSDSSTSDPQLIDLAKIESPTPITTSVEWILGNNTKSVVSLLDSNSLFEFQQVVAQYSVDGLKLFTPFRVDKRKRITPTLTSDLSVYSLEMSERAMAHALVHRATKVGCDALVPILDDLSFVSLLEHFRSASPIPLLPPVFLYGEGSGNLSADLMASSDNGTTPRTIGVILLSAKNGSEMALRVWEESGRSQHLRWFSPKLLQHPQEGPTLFGLYSVQYVGSGVWDNPERRRLLRRLNQFTGPSPLILQAVLTYDAVHLARLHASDEFELKLKNGLTGMSGDIQFDKEGDRLSGTYLGVSAVPHSTALSPVPLLQPSQWVLEDSVHAIPNSNDGEFQLIDHQIATSSILTEEELLQIPVVNRGRCTNETLKVSAHDPFNQMTYDYTFNRTTLPDHLIIPNQYGFGLHFHCTQSDDIIASLTVACTPSGQATLADGVHCFRSNVHRVKRGTKYSKNNARDDSSLYYQPPTPADLYSAPPVYSYASSAEPSTEAPPPPPPPPSKLPDLRAILKAAKPFMASCIGATTGCAICVLVLGRLPLGPVPAICAGPCFVGTFGSCGSLLGRVFAETTVICTELFRQGLLDVDTFIADAQFGQHLLSTSPLTLQGYQRLAMPLVSLMQSSMCATKIVAKVALPWSYHMKYLMGHSEEWNLVGWLLHWIGVPICWMTGLIENQMNYSVTTRLFWLLILLILTWRKCFGKTV